MADINVNSPRSRNGKDTHGGAEAPNELAFRDTKELYMLIEALFFAYRDFTGDPDRILDEIGFGRAHHRVLHFVNRYPGMRVADLLEILQITKQSLARVLRELVCEGYIEQRPAEEDRRARLLFVTPKGRALARRLPKPAWPATLERVEAIALTSAGKTRRLHATSALPGKPLNGPSEGTR